MGLLDLFKRKQKIIDDLFGELVYTRFSSSEKNFFSGEATLDSQRIGASIDADEKGATKEQKDFFIKLRNSYPAIKKDIIIPFLRNELEQWEENEVIDFDKEFSLDGISISRITGKPVEWSLTLYSSQIQHCVTIEFLDFDPQEGVAVDG